MGRLLDQWMQENSRSLQALAPVPQMAPPTAPAFGQGAQVPGAAPAFSAGGGPMAAPVNVQSTPGAAVGQFDAFQPSPMTPVAFPEEATAAGGGPGAGTQVMDAMEERRRTQAAEEGVIPEGTAGPGGIVEEGREAPDGEIRLPAEGEEFSAQDAMSQTPEAVDKAVDELERTTGVPVEETYTQVTGNPPPQNMKRREMGSFLFEFGLNLMAAPAGVSDVETFGGALQQTMGGRRARRESAASMEREERQAQHERRMELAEYGLKRREVEALESGQMERFVRDDGVLMEYEPGTGRATPILDAEGNEIKGPPGSGTGGNTQAEYLFTATLDNHKEMARLAGVEWTPQMEITAREAAAVAMRGLRPSEGRTDAEMRRTAEESARALLKDSPDFLAGTPEERDAMITAAQTKAYNWEKYGTYAIEPPAGPEPDVANIPEGQAVPVTDEHGRTNYWVRQTDPESGSVQVRKLTAAEVRELTGG